MESGLEAHAPTYGASLGGKDNIHCIFYKLKLDPQFKWGVLACYCEMYVLQYWYLCDCR